MKKIRKKHDCWVQTWCKIFVKEVKYLRYFQQDNFIDPKRDNPFASIPTTPKHKQGISISEATDQYTWIKEKKKNDEEH